jgi:hypothetical protein
LPNTATSTTGFDGKCILAGGVTVVSSDYSSAPDALTSDFLSLAPEADATVSTSWVRTYFLDVPYSPTTPSFPYRNRQGISAFLFPSGNGPNGPSTKDVGFTGGYTQVSFNNAFVDFVPGRLENFKSSTGSWDYSLNSGTWQNEGYATCFTGSSMLNQGRVIGVRAFGRYKGVSQTTNNLEIEDQYTMATSRSKTVLNWGFPGAANTATAAPSRYQVGSVGGGRFCAFAGGYDTTNGVYTVYNQINFFDTMAPNATVDVPTGAPIPTPNALALTQPRRFVAAAFLPRANSGGMTGYNGYMLFAGGQLAGGYVTDQIDIIDTSRPMASWYNDNSLRLSVARRGAVAIGVGSRYIFIAGGITGSGAVSNVIDQFDGYTFTMSSFPQKLQYPRQLMMPLVHLKDSVGGNYIVIFAGGATDGADPPVSTSAAVETIYITGAGAMP